MFGIAPLELLHSSTDIVGYHNPGREVLGYLVVTISQVIERAVKGWESRTWHAKDALVLCLAIFHYLCLVYPRLVHGLGSGRVGGCRERNHLRSRVGAKWQWSCIALQWRSAELFPKGHLGFDQVCVSPLAMLVWRLWGPQTDAPWLYGVAAPPQRIPGTRENYKFKDILTSQSKG